MGLVDSLFGKDARKFLKRKDSDAAEAGEWFICSSSSIDLPRAFRKKNSDISHYIESRCFLFSTLVSVLMVLMGLLI